MDWKNADNKAKELNGHSFTSGINWSWVSFDKYSDAHLFVAWLDQNGFDHRGVYGSTATSEPASVRYR